MKPREFKVQKVPQPQKISNGDVLINVNCYEYLGHIAVHISKQLATHLQTEIPILSQLRNMYFDSDGNSVDYMESERYGNLYTEFLKDLQDKSTILLHAQYQAKDEIQKLETRLSLMSLSREKDPNIISNLSKNIEANQDIYNAITLLIDRLYNNPNKALERSYLMVKPALSSVSFTSLRSESIVTARLQGQSKGPGNAFTPQYAGSLWGRARQYVTDFNPMTETNLPSVRVYPSLMKSGTMEDSKNTPVLPRELRFGTQIIVKSHLITGDEYQVNPLFYLWLKSRENQYGMKNTTVANYTEVISRLNEDWFKYPKDKKKPEGTADKEVKTRQKSTFLDKNIHDEYFSAPDSPRPDFRSAPKIKHKEKTLHVYINNLSFREHGIEGERERALTIQLHQLSKSYPHLVVITLPAQMSLLNRHELHKHEVKLNCDSAINTISDIASGKIKNEDFFISRATKRMLYGRSNKPFPYNEDKEKQILKKLISNSFELLGFSKQKEITEPQLQAVFFHFIKYEMTNFILETLQPETFNISCKDAIDRGGVSSAYFNLLYSIIHARPLTRNEFEIGLIGAPTIVKGRGINSHIRLCWNAIDAFIKGYIKAIHEGETPRHGLLPKWLIEWRNENRLESALNQTPEDPCKEPPMRKTPR